MFKQKGFTLIELLVVVLIIGILTSIAVPQYQKAVLKSELHRGIPLVESLYQAQQSYLLTHGTFAKDIDELDVSVPKNENCKKTQNTTKSGYQCNFGNIFLSDSFANVVFHDKNSQIQYKRYLTDLNANDLERKAGEVWCFAKSKNKTAQAVCEQIGGELKQNDSSYYRYKVR